MGPSDSDGLQAIEDIVAKVFTEIKQDMDTIVNSGDISVSVEGALFGPASSTAAVREDAVSGVSSEQLPAVQLGHGRTQSESPGYYDHELTDPASRLPEAVVDLTSSGTAAAAAASAGISLARKYAISGSNSSKSFTKRFPDSADACTVPTASGPCCELDSQLDSEAITAVPAPALAAPAVAAARSSSEQRAAPASQLTYEELLERAVAGMDPKLQQMSNNLLHRSNSKGATALQNSSSSSRSSGSSSGTSGSGSTPARPNSHGRARAGVPEKAQVLSQQAWQPQSKFPASSSTRTGRGSNRSADDNSSLGGSSNATGLGSVRIFKQGSGSAMRLLGEVEERPPLAAAASQRASNLRSSMDSQGSRRSNSAPRESAAVDRHVQRMSRSPGATGTAASSGGAARAGAASEQAQSRSKSNPRYSKTYIERLYNMGVEKQHKRAQQPDCRSVSPVRLTEEDRARVTMRLHKDAERKEERMRARRRHAEGETEAAANLTCHPGGNTLQDRLHSMAANARSSSSGSSAMSSSGGAPSAAFYKRQEAAWQRRGERVKQKRPSDEDELKECTFHPEISEASRQLRRSVDDMLKWEDHKRFHVWQLGEDKAEHEYDGYTWVPEISARSRRLALEKYAAAPDPARPWTTSPRHTAVPPRQPSPPRQSSPPPRSIFSASYALHGEPAYSYVTPEQLRHSIAGPHMLHGSAGTAGSAAVTYDQARQQSHSEPAAGPSSRLVQGNNSSAAMQLEYLEGYTAQKSLGMSAQAHPLMQQQQQHEHLPPGVVVGIPVFPGHAQVSPAVGTLQAVQLPDGAVGIQMKAPAAAGSAAKALVPVAPGDGVAFISLGAIRTSPTRTPASGPAAAPEAAAGTEATADVDMEAGPPVAGSVDWQQALIRAAGSGGGYDDSAANTPLKQEYLAAMAGKPAAAGAAVAARAFRDDSAGGMSAPVRKVSTGGSWFSPVVSAHKASPLSKQKQQEAGGHNTLQPTLSDATRAALALSHLGLKSGLQQDLAAAAAAQQQVPAFYVALDSSPHLADSYSARYAYSKAAAAAAGCNSAAPGTAGEGFMEGSFACDEGFRPEPNSWHAATEDTVEADKKAAMAEWQQQQQAAAQAALKPHYSTAQLLNAKQRSSSAGLKPLSAEPSTDSTGLPSCSSGTAIMEHPAAVVAAVAAMAEAATAQSITSADCREAQQGDVAAWRQLLGDVGYGTASALAAEQTVTDPAQFQELLAGKAEGMLDQTQSVPIELNVSPRSRLYLSSNAKGKPATAQQLALLSQQEAAAVSSGRDSPRSGNSSSSGSFDVLSSTSQQQLVQNLLRPAAGSPYLPDSRLSSPAFGNSCVPTPQGSSHNLMVTSLHRSQLAAAGASHGSSKLSIGTSSKTAGAAVQGEAAAESASPASPAHAQTAGSSCMQTALQPAAAEDANPVAVTEESAGEGAQQLAVSSAVPEDCDSKAAAAVADEGEAVSAAELLGLLFDPTISPQDKARKMQATFKKTISHRNIPLSSLEQTLAALVPAAGTPPTSEVPAAAQAHAPGSPAATYAPESAATSAPAPAAGASASPAATSPVADRTDESKSKPYENAQDLLAHISELDTRSVPAAGSWSTCSSPSARKTPGSAVTTPAPQAAKSPTKERMELLVAAGNNSLHCSTPCSPAADALRAEFGAAELQVGNSSRINSAAGASAEPRSPSGGRRSYVAVAMRRSPNGSGSGGSGCSSPVRASCRITQFAAVSSSLSGQASEPRQDCQTGEADSPAL